MEETTPAESESEPGEMSVFIPADTLGKPVKEGDTITLTVKAVDPDTGEIEASPVAGGSEPMSERMPYEAAMDEKMPED